MRHVIPSGCAVGALLWGLALAWGPERAAAAASQTSAPEQTVPAEVTRALTRVGPFTPTDLAALQSGRVITRTDASPEDLEASVVTAVRIATTRDRTAEYFHLLVSYVDGQVTTGHGVFSRPPSESDVSGLALEPADLADLSACRAELCDISIGAATPTEISRAVDWHAPDAADRANVWVRRSLVPYVAAYATRGDVALAGHDDRGAPVDFAMHWRELFARSPLLPMLAPALERYLAAPTTERPSEATEEIYWDKQHYTGLKPVLGVTHLVIWRDPAQPDRIVIAQKQIFASHYFYGSLAVTLIRQDSTATTPTTYVVYTNRLRGGLLRGTQGPTQTGLRARVSGLGASLQRRLGEELVKQSAEGLMSAMKQALER